MIALYMVGMFFIVESYFKALTGYSMNSLMHHRLKNDESPTRHKKSSDDAKQKEDSDEENADENSDDEDDIKIPIVQKRTGWERKKPVPTKRSDFSIPCGPKCYLLLSKKSDQDGRTTPSPRSSGRLKRKTPPQDDDVPGADWDGGEQTLLKTLNEIYYNDYCSIATIIETKSCQEVCELSRKWNLENPYTEQEVPKKKKRKYQ